MHRRVDFGYGVSSQKLPGKALTSSVARSAHGQKPCLGLRLPPTRFQLFVIILTRLISSWVSLVA